MSGHARSLGMLAWLLAVALLLRDILNSSRAIECGSNRAEYAADVLLAVSPDVRVHLLL